MKKIFTIGLIAMTLGGCASTTLESQKFKSYTVGQTKTAVVGEPFLTDQNGSISTVRRWVGIFNSPDGWETKQIASADFVRKELTYSGKSGPTIEISYREFRGGYAAPAFAQSLKYDLSESKIVRFQKFQIEVLRADNQTFKYTILSD